MAEYLIQGEILSNLANKVRELDGTEEAMTPDEMSNAVETFNSDMTAIASEQTDLIGQIMIALDEKAAVSLPELENPAGSEQILSGYQGIDSTGAVVTGAHTCKTLAQLLPSRSNPAGANEILSGYQGISSTGDVVSGAYVPPAAGAEYEIIITSSSASSTVSSSLAGITHCYGSTNNKSFMNSAGAVGLCDNTLYWISKSGSTSSPTYKGSTANVTFNGGTITSSGSNFRNMNLLFLYDANGG